MSAKVLTIGQPFPAFRKPAVISINAGQEFIDITGGFKNDKGRWTVMFWWPKDLSFVCPTEIAEFNKNFSQFCERKANLIGASTDSEFTHLAWRKNHKDLKDLQFPMLADTSKSLAEELGILDDREKVAYRATFIIDPEGIIRWVNVNDMNVGRNVQEVLRVLDALQTGELCPVNWQKGKETIKIDENH